jgi:dTMP kinase
VRGRLVAFEGIDGSGKSTALAAVAAGLRAQGLRLESTREETDGPTGEAVRRSIDEGWPPLATAFLFAADRAVHVRAIEATLARGVHVLSDRFLHSSLAYQSVTLKGVVPDPLAFLRSLHAGWCPEPDHVVLVTCDPEAAVSRITQRGQATAYEKAAFLAQVQHAYLRLAREAPTRFTIVDGGQPAELLAQDALRAVLSALV